MNVLPVITRELRAQARQPFTYSLRALGVLALLGGGVAFAVGHPFAPNLGGALFGYLHFTLFTAIWILVPLSAADCISRERREGTLGLLFLTPLKPTDIVIAKGLAHALRAVTLLVAVLPVLTIPFLLGGVSWQQATMSTLVNFSSICWTLAAALVASSGNRSGSRAMAGAVIFAIIGMFLFGAIAGFLMSHAFTGLRIWPRSSSDYIVFLSFGFMERGMGGSFGGFSLNPVFWAFVGVAVCSILALAGAVWLAAWQIRRTWRDEPPPVWVQACQKTFCTPVLAVEFFRRWMRRKLQRNPIGWLEQRTWQGRLLTWSWFAVIISIYSAVLSDRNFFRNANQLQATLAWLLMGSIASSAAGSFRRERETGVLELLLVSPLTTGQIIGGRLRGLWGQFLPSVSMLLGLWLYFDTFFRSRAAVGPVFFFGVTFLTLPVIGLYFSVRCQSYLSAFILTLAIGLGVPLALKSLIEFIIFLQLGPMATNVTLSDSSMLFWKILPSLTQGGLACSCLLWLRRRLTTKSFPLERAAT